MSHRDLGEWISPVGPLGPHARDPHPPTFLSERSIFGMTRRAEDGRRADILIAERGLARSRSHAQELVRRGCVSVNGRPLTKPGALLREDAVLQVEGPSHDFVSRGGHKLHGALPRLGVSLRDKTVVDVGASTGGFTDCALQGGARKVYAIDVGQGQLDPRLRDDPRVVSWEGTNARDLDAARFAEPVDVVLVDAAFISLEKLAPALARILPVGAELVALVKPQFEVGAATARKSRGVIRNPAERSRAIASARGALESAGFEIRAECDSELAGPKGNVERFVYARRTTG